MTKPAILAVDDRPENLIALRAILEPLGHEVVEATSGEQALRSLLTRDDFAVILLDVQMPVLDGFETAAAIKQRERTRNIPIIFVTALSTEAQHAFRGYQAGAVDYVTKPFDADILRAKVAGFIELWQKTEQLQQQTELLAEQELATIRRQSEARYRQLADAMPQIVWTSDADGRATSYNERWFEFTGMAREEAGAAAWATVVHPDDLPNAVAVREASLASGSTFEVEYRFRSADGIYRWHLGRAVPISGQVGAVDFWVGTATDIDDRKREMDAQQFLLEASAELSSSLDYEQTLGAVAKLAVPRIADWCAIDIAGGDGALRRLAVEHVVPDKLIFARELQERYPPSPGAARGPAAVARTGASEISPEISDALLLETAVDDTHLSLMREVGARSYICAPIVSRGRVLGAITLVSTRSGHRFEQADLRVAEALGRQAGAAIDNAELYQEAERRARASLALETIADGVVMVDNEDVVLLWNAAAEAITGLKREEVVGRKVAETLPGYAERAHVTADGVRGETVPLEVAGRELWLSVSGVSFDTGSVYVFRDFTEERALEQMRSDFVATVSHELRTPLAAIYGAAVTLRRGDLELSAELRERLLGVVAEESDRLAQIVNDVLLASHLDSGKLQVRIEKVDVTKLTETVVEAARAHLPDHITLTLDNPKHVPGVAADEQQLRQVLVNLIENAVKYSPDGGPVGVTLSKQPRSVRWTIADRGLGIPPSERRRIFEKFYRLDPNMTRGIGGTGLGLYICRELVRRFEGKIWVESEIGRGSTFFVEIPIAEQGARRRPRRQQAA